MNQDKINRVVKKELKAFLEDLFDPNYDKNETYVNKMKDITACIQLLKFYMTYPKWKKANKEWEKQRKVMALIKIHEMKR